MVNVPANLRLTQIRWIRVFKSPRSWIRLRSSLRTLEDLAVNKVWFQEVVLLIKIVVLKSLSSKMIIFPRITRICRSFRCRILRKMEQLGPYPLIRSRIRASEKGEILAPIQTHQGKEKLLDRKFSVSGLRIQKRNLMKCSMRDPSSPITVEHSR